ncbi:hypothetical protein MMC22_005906 [Lobaria immixta]|nr:hypothetical protein [Lobaria immixta]
MPRILLLGGAGKIALHLTPLLLARGSSYQLTSVIRNPDQTDTIKAAAKGQPGTCNVLVRSLDEVTSEEQAKGIIEEAGAEWVVWSAGAGGKGGASRTYAIDRDACNHFIQASASLPNVNTFLLISYIGSRRRRAPWWTESDWAGARSANEGPLKDYHAAKLAADECLTAVARKRGSGFRGIVLRPGTLTDEEEGKVALGKTKASGGVARRDVARVAVDLLENAETGAWLDLLQGDEQEVGEAVKRVVKESVDCIEGEDVEAIVQRWT